jgi:O-antigen/teichoic acid export membrane protein
MISNDDTRPEPSCRLRPDTLAASVAILLLANLVQRSIGFGRGILFCRWLDPDELGTWEMAYSFLLMAAPLVVLGLPGSFGRYLERYRQRGQLRTFLRRASIWTILLSLSAATLLVWAAPKFSMLIFGQPDEHDLVILIAFSLMSVILHHFLEALFAALRKFSIVSMMHFCQSMLFAVLSLALLWWWRLSAQSIVIGYGMACLVSSAMTLVWMRGALADELSDDDGVSHREFWPPLVRFAIWVWVTNLLCNVFAVVDRYMLVHWGGLDSKESLALIGHYHASRILPLLFLSLADLLAGIALPHLSHDWEAGLRQQVSERLNLIIKLAAIGMLAAGVAVLWIAPLLFQVAFAGRYGEGLAVLPWTLAYCVWYGLLQVAQNYLWCAEKTKLGTLPLAIGLVANVLLNLVLIPPWGLLGAVMATAASTAVSLAVLYWLTHRSGMRLELGTIWLSLTPIALCGGALIGTTTLLVLVPLLLLSEQFINQSEKMVITSVYRSYWFRITNFWSRPIEQPEPGHAN